MWGPFTTSIRWALKSANHKCQRELQRDFLEVHLQCQRTCGCMAASPSACCTVALGGHIRQTIQSLSSTHVSHCSPSLVMLGLSRNLFVDCMWGGAGGRRGLCLCVRCPTGSIVSSCSAHASCWETLLVLHYSQHPQRLKKVDGEKELYLHRMCVTPINYYLDVMQML